jgi:hypothetical protein
MNNPLKKSVVTWFSIGILGFFLIFLPETIGIEGMSGGFAISFISLFVAIIGAVGGILYYLQLRILNRMLKGYGLLAHWKYSMEDRFENSKEQYDKENAEKRSLFLAISFFAVLFGFFLWTFDFENGIYVLTGMFGLILLIGIVWKLSMRLGRFSSLEDTREVYISKEGVFFNHRLDAWNLVLSSLLDVKLQESKGVKMLVFNYSTFAFPPRVNFVRVPIPKNYESAADSVIETLRNEIRKA